MKNYSWLDVPLVSPTAGGLKLTHSVLSELNESEEWKSWGGAKKGGFTPENVYGPLGSLRWLWGRNWSSPKLMLGDCLTNMGGGVPASVIYELVDLCHQESLVANV